MPLSKYREKRDLSKTTEPLGFNKQKTNNNRLRFVVQKHQTSRMHYDFRLEVDGVLKSWAIPKGPSLDPSQKHLAIMVEDHPIEYKDFEGVIPKGNYGAGTVMVWDEGLYQPIGALSKGSLKTAFKTAIQNGHLAFVLAGKKLNGEFALIKLNGAAKNDWLLVKANDQYASDKNVLSQDRSAKTDMSMAEINRTDQELPKIISNNRISDIPKNVKPMLSTLTDSAFNKPSWIFEIKWDGFRAITEISKNKIRLYSRNNQDFGEMFPQILDSFKGYKKDAVFDGEIVVVDKKGRSSFQLLQEYQTTGKGSLIYFIFDIIYFDGHDLTALPLETRRDILKKVMPQANNIKFSEDIKEQGKKLFEVAKKQDLEGIMAKLLTSTYQIGKRSQNWLKIKIHQRQEAVICGFTKPKGSRKGFGALLLGVYEDDQLTYIGDVGTGLNDKLLDQLSKLMKPLITKTSPFDEIIKNASSITWVKPSLVCEIKFQEWTKDGHMRQPVFLGLRNDKAAKEVKIELPINQQIPSQKIQPNNFSNSNKVFWPDLGITKGDLLKYYLKVSKFLLPYLAGRPESLNRFPDGVGGESFFQKNVEKPPIWMNTFKDVSGEDQHEVNYIICDDIQGLEYIINLGCMDLNVWNSKAKNPDKPDYMIFDLDPEDINFDHVLETALVFKKVLKSIGIKSYPKTSGKRGIHIYVPLGHKYTFNQVSDFAHLIAMQVHTMLPKITSLERSPKKRQGKVYLDFLQNHLGATTASPYSVRAVPAASVSMPVTWNEVEKGIKPEDFTIKNAMTRIEKLGDIFLPVLGKGADLKLAINKFAKIYKR